MTMLTHARGLHAPQQNALANRMLDGASHLAALKRFAKIAMGLAAIVLVVAAVAAIKLAIFFPRFVH